MINQQQIAMKEAHSLLSFSILIGNVLCSTGTKRRSLARVHQGNCKSSALHATKPIICNCEQSLHLFLVGRSAIRLKSSWPRLQTKMQTRLKLGLTSRWSRLVTTAVRVVHNPPAWTISCLCQRLLMLKVTDHVATVHGGTAPWSALLFWVNKAEIKYDIAGQVGKVVISCCQPVFGWTLDSEESESGEDGSRGEGRERTDRAVCARQARTRGTRAGERGLQKI